MSESEIFGGEAPVEKPKGPSLGDQLLGVFTSPVELFQRTNETPVWAGAMVLLMAASLLMVVVWGLKVDMDAMLRPILEQNPQISASQVDAIISMQSKFILPFAIAGVLIGTPAAFLLVALIRWLVGLGTAEGEKPSYMQALSSVSVSSLTAVPYMVLISVMCLLRKVGGLAPEKLSPTSLAFYIHPENPKLMGLMTQLDLFILAGFVMAYLSARHGMRLKPLGAWICTALAVLGSVVFKVLLAK